MDAKYSAIVAAVIAGSATMGAALITTLFKNPAPASSAASSSSAAQPSDKDVSSGSSGEPVAIAAAARPQETDDGTSARGELYAQATSSINVRSAPALDAPKIFSIPSGRAFTVLDSGSASTWIKVEFEGQTGYIRKGENYVVTG